jgi:NitT/TauT family transport system substrate-binding protein
MTDLTRRTVLGSGLVAASTLAAPRIWAQPVPEIRLASQYGMGYLQFDIMQHNNLIEKHAKDLGLPNVKVTWASFSGTDAMNQALISGAADVVAGGIPGLLTVWSRTRGTKYEIKGISALSSQAYLLNTRSEKVRTIRDFTLNDRIAVGAVKLSTMAVTLEIAASKEWGDAEYARLDPQTVSMSPGDATVAMISGVAGITSVFAIPPYQQEQLQHPVIHTVLNSHDVMDGPVTFTCCWGPTRFQADNPKLYAALLRALEEATPLVTKDARATAELWKTRVGSKLDTDFVAKCITDPAGTGELGPWTTVPENSMKFAKFMARVGTISHEPASWKDYFHSQIHDVAGS